MKIAYFTDTLCPEINGVTNTLGYLKKYLGGKGIEHEVFAPGYGGDGSPEEEDVIRFKGHRPFVYPNSCLAFPGHKAVQDAILDFEPDLIHITTELGVGYAGLRAARELDIPIVKSYHTNFDRYLKFYESASLDKPYWAYMKWFHSFSKINLCPSKDTALDLEARGFENLEIWSRGIDSSQFSPARYSESIRESLGGTGKTVFLYVGRLAREKGLDTLLDAARIINEKFTDKTVFVFTGDGPFKKELKEACLPNTVFTGFKRGDELASIYASSDIFVFPSGTETFGNVLLEAMSSGMPCICTDSGGVRDYTEHLDNAFVCRYGSAESLAYGMEVLMKDAALRKKIAASALKTAIKRDWDTIFDELVSRYEKVLSSKSIYICIPSGWMKV